MDLIHFQGLNCYFDCVVSIAASFGLKYEDAFATLWSETDLFYDPRLNAYSTKRMLANLAAMGLQYNCLGCATTNEAIGHLSPVNEGDLIIVGMDAFFIPWSPIYKALHDPHYFVARKVRSDLFICDDPTYGEKDMELSPEHIALHAYDICRNEKKTPKALSAGVESEARDILRNHSKTKETLLLVIDKSVGEGRKNAALLARYVDALINNRYLFMRFLQTSAPDSAAHGPFFDKDFFSQWTAAKNGLFKASLMQKNIGILDEVRVLVDGAIDEEILKASLLLNAQYHAT